MKGLERAIAALWGGCEELSALVSKRSASLIEHQQRRVDQLPDGEAAEKARASLARGWLKLDAEARGRGARPKIDAWLGERNRVAVLVSSDPELEVQGVAVFTASELLQFVPADILAAKAAFEARVYHKIDPQMFPFDDPIPF